MIKLRQVNCNTYLFEDSSKVHVFDNIGRYIGTQQITAEIAVGAVNVGVLSVLCSKDLVEIGIDCTNTFKKYTQNYSEKDLLLLIGQTNGFIKQLIRVGKVNNKDYIQRLFIYPSTVSISLLLSQIKVELKEVL